MKSRLRFLILCAVLATATAPAGCHKGGPPPSAKDTEAVKARLDAIRAKGEPTTLAEVNAAYRAPAATEDAGPILTEAFSKLSSTDSKSPGFLEQNQAVLPLLHEAARRGKCRFPTDLTAGAQTQAKHLVSMRNCIQLLTAHANRQVEVGNLEGASQALLDGLAVSRILESEPLVISQLVRSAGEGLCFQSLEKALGSLRFNESQLSSLQAAFQAAEQGSSLTPAFLSERCMAYSFFQGTAVGFETMIREGAKLSGDTVPHFKPGELGSYWGSAAFVRDSAHVLDAMSEWIAATREPFPECFAAIEKARRRFDEAAQNRFLISEWYLRNMPSMVSRYGRVEAQMRLAQVALAIQRSRLQHDGALPGTLNELVPGLLSSVPTDPFDGRPLRYLRRTQGGYMLHSIGSDRRDDGGQKGKEGGDDIALVVVR